MKEEIVWHEYAKDKPPESKNYLTVMQGIKSGSFKYAVEISYAYKKMFDSNYSVCLFWAELPESPIELTK